MPEYLSQEWLDEARALAQDQPERPGVSATMQFVVTGAPDGDVKYYWVLQDGLLTEAALGELPDAEVTLTTTYQDSVAIQKGELDANAATQYSVIARTLSWRVLYSGAMVSGMSCMSLPMLPVTLVLPCMNAALASSSPFWIATES